MLGKWNKWYDGKTKQGSFRYGNTVTYQRAADYMADIDILEDWGCGMGGFKRLFKGNYTGLDGSKTPFVDKVVDLREYTSSVDGIVLRHVLEHNYDWEKILENAVNSFQKKLCIIIFTPFVEETKEIAHNKRFGVDCPDIAFYEEDIEKYFKDFAWLKEDLGTKTAYGAERIYYVRR